MTITFRPVTRADGELLRSWIARPHFQEWWGNSENDAREIIDNLDNPNFGPFIILLDGRDAGYIQWWKPDGTWELPIEVMPEITRGIDLSLAEEADLGRGIGRQVIAAFVDRLAQEGVRRILIDPSPDNIRARRAYAAAGFTDVTTAVGPDGPYVLMSLDLPP